MENHWHLATEEILICDTPDCPALQELRYQQARERKRRLASSIAEEVPYGQGYGKIASTTSFDTSLYASPGTTEAAGILYVFYRHQEFLGALDALLLA